MNEDRWFSEQQQLLLAMANTDNGRDLLCIRRDFPKIDKIAKNFIRAEIMPGKYVSEFRIGCKYANIIRYRWKEFQEMTQWFYASTYTNVFNMHFPVALAGTNRRFTTSIFYPDAAPESTSVDGFTYQNYAVGSGVVWTTIRTDTGNTASDSGTDGYIFRAIGDNTAGTPYWYRNYRSIMLFDTSIIGGDSIVSAVFSPYGKAKLDEPSITPSCNVYSSNPTLNTALQGSDYSTVGTTAYCDTPITYA
ncbi:MAG: hypothetical protein KKF27_20965, partial [Gammaproteobacteria bacterium]|nr:hypothetical protein [Gammaproteobacteria bacterium]